MVRSNAVDRLLIGDFMFSVNGGYSNGYRVLHARLCYIFYGYLDC